jgi:hypothetical protein
VAKQHTNMLEVLAGLAPAIGEVIGGLTNESYAADDVLPSVTIAQRPGSLTGSLLRYAPDALLGDVALDDEVPEGADPGEGEAGSVQAVAFSGRRYMRNSLHDNMLIDALQGMGEAEAIGYLENLCMPTSIAMRIRREQRTAALYQTAANFASTAAAAVVWTNPLADIIGELDTAYRSVKQFGRRPNMLIIPEATAAAMRTAPQLLDFLPTNIDRNRMSDEALVGWLKDKFALEIVRIADAVRNTSAVNGTLTTGGCWANGTVFMGYVPASGGVAGAVGTPVRIGEAMLTPSATACVKMQDWQAEAIEHATSPRKGYRFSYIEWAGVYQPQLGATITGCV